MRVPASKRSKSAAERWLHALLEQEDEAIAIVDSTGSIRLASPALATFLQANPDPLTGQNLLDELRHRSKGLEHLVADAIRFRTPWEGRLNLRRDSGEACELHVRVHPISDGEFLVAFRNISREAELELRIAEAQKMEAIGRLAGGVAHDFNNLLTSIIGFAQLALEQLPPDHPAARDLLEIVNAGRRATQLTHHLLMFSRKRVVEPQLIDVNQVILVADKILRQSLGEDIELVVLLDSALPMVWADEGLLEQAILNLAINARDAMPQGGKLTLQTQRVQLDPGFCDRRVDVLPGEYVVIRMRDTGVGMDEAVRSHLFEPFFTTKEKGKGTGLGLATVYATVRQFNGFVEVDTAPGQGSEFRLYFPAASERIARTPGERPRQVRGGTERILVVEDEPSLRFLVCRVLRSYGYQVTEARHGQEALAALHQMSEPPDLILTDIVMPQMNGPQLVREVKKLYPSVKVLYMSGFVGEASETGARQREAPLLRKPFTAEELAGWVREALDATNSPPTPSEVRAHDPSNS